MTDNDLVVLKDLSIWRVSNVKLTKVRVRIAAPAHE